MVIPCSVSDAREFVRQFHRHHQPPVSGLFAVACARPGTEEEFDDLGPGESLDGAFVRSAMQSDAKVVGVAIVGRPVARLSDDGFTAEVTRVATDGTRNACSMLYGACWRAARALGYRRLMTYTLASEPGTSLRAAGWREIGKAGGGSWSRGSRPRVDRHPTQEKIRWEAIA
jgi:hypothetical protein